MSWADSDKGEAFHVIDSRRQQSVPKGLNALAGKCDIERKFR